MGANVSTEWRSMLDGPANSRCSDGRLVPATQPPLQQICAILGDAVEGSCWISQWLGGGVCISLGARCDNATWNTAAHREDAWIMADIPESAAVYSFDLSRQFWPENS